MVLTYSEAVREYGSEYRLSKAVSSGEIYKIEEGIYSHDKYVPELAIVMKKYPKAVITGKSALYYQGFTNLIPEKYDLATSAKSAKITDTRIHQIYIDNRFFMIGIEEKKVDGVIVRIYDKERMLIELLRSKNSMPYDLYKEAIIGYREIIDTLEIWRIQEYAESFPKSKMISKALDEEVL